METSKYDLWLKNDQIMKKNQLPGEFIERGTSLYEVIRVISGVPTFFEEHMERLTNTSRLTGSKLPLDEETMRKRVHELINLNQAETGNIKIVVNYPYKEAPADFYAYYIETNYPSPTDYQNGVKTVLVRIQRPNPNAKVDRADYRRVIDSAKKETGSYEALLVDQEGNVREGGRSNLFMIKGDIVYTAPDDKVLKGINRKMVLKACYNMGQQVVEKDVGLEEMLTMEALFLTGTSPQVLPISQVDDHRIASADNPILRAIMTEFANIVEEHVIQYRAYA